MFFPPPLRGGGKNWDVARNLQVFRGFLEDLAEFSDFKIFRYVFFYVGFLLGLGEHPLATTPHLPQIKSLRR